MGASSAAFLNLNVPSVASFAGESVRTTVSRLIIKSPCTSVSTLTTSSFRALLLLPFAASPLDILVEFGFLALTLLTLTGPLGLGDFDGDDGASILSFLPPMASERFTLYRTRSRGVVLVGMVVGMGAAMVQGQPVRQLQGEAFLFLSLCCCRGFRVNWAK